VVPSGTQIRRPHGIYYAPNTTPPKPAYGPSQALDFELEMGYFVASPVSFAQTMDIADAKEHIFGFVLLNDWSARDLQMFEKTPLGPFHGKGEALPSKPDHCIC
jgi:fumarylacetoacetase